MYTKSLALASVKIAMMAAAKQASTLRLRTLKVTCKPGCSACCKRYVAITIAEAMVIVESLKRSKKWDRVASAAKEQRGVHARPASWFKMGLSCPVLNQQDRCDAYQVRPASCSAHFVISPPEACSPLSTSFNRYEPCEFTQVHMDFAKAFDAAIGNKSTLRIKAPMHEALLIGERLSMKLGSDFDEMIAVLAKEFGT